jgi:cob(I)alamin adenosyltransferase
MLRKGLLLVHTGKGKGKTTAALGLAMRALGQNLRVCIVQFIKGTWKYGELESFKRFDDLAEFHVFGKGFTWKSENLDEDIRVAREAWTFAEAKLRDPQYAMVILDELTYLVKYGMVPEERILAGLAARPETMHAVVTGRDASPGLVEAADLVTEMHEVKHPFHNGVKAQRGIEF